MRASALLGLFLSIGRAMSFQTSKLDLEEKPARRRRWKKKRSGHGGGFGGIDATCHTVRTRYRRLFKHAGIQ